MSAPAIVTTDTPGPSRRGRGLRRLLVLVPLILGLTVVPVASTLGRWGVTKVQKIPVRTVPVGLPALASLKAVNYDPADGAWTYLWLKWDRAQIDQDFGRIASLSANAVRLAVFPSVFGWPQPSAAMQAELSQTIGLASAHGLRVELTLFDWWGSYSYVSESEIWAQAIVAPWRDDPKIAFIELQNEINPRDSQAMAWAGQLMPVVKRSAGVIPVTVSVSNVGSISATDELHSLMGALAATPPDFYDMHVYGPAGLAYSKMAAAKAMVAPAQLYIGEVGSSSGTGAAAPTTALAEAEQAQFLRTIEWAAQANGLPPIAVWTYRDFNPGGVPPASSLSGDGFFYGLFRGDGTEKPAAAVLAAYFADGTVDTGLGGGFEANAEDQPVGWQQYRPDMGTLAWDSAVAHSGAASVRLSQTRGDSHGSAAFSTEPVITPSAVGQQFQLAAWAKGASSSGANVVSVSWFGAGGAYLGQQESTALPSGNPGWMQLSAVVTVPASGLYAKIFVKSAGNPGTVWFDDVTFTPLPSSDTAPPTTAVAALPAPPPTHPAPATPAPSAVAPIHATPLVQVAHPVQGIVGPTGPLTVIAGQSKPIPTSAPLSAHIVAVTQTASRQGSWVAASDGAVFTTADAGFYGSMGGQRLNKPVNGMTVTTSGRGYWLVASDGGIFSFGDAVFFGSMGGSHLNQPIVGMSATPSGHGYWLVASDGGIFSFGDAQFYGSTGTLSLNAPVAAMTPTPTGRGYWFVASDGGVFCFGDAAFKGSAGAMDLHDITGMLPAGGGYYLTRAGGQVLTYGTPSG